ncbi:MAG: hypothetical protein NTW74_23500 [Acidobacteria bacterium]|nr:hypothetical protein [Acidobacteriota bacterium]
MKLLILASAFSAVALLAQPSSEVQFNNCTEYVGAGWVPLAQAAPFVPNTFQVLKNGPQALLVTRASECQSVVIDNSKPEAVRLSQIGVSVVSPDGTGDINNYTVIYVTNSKRLAQRLERAGLPVKVDEDLAYEVNAGNLFVDVSPEDGPAYFFNGAVTDPAPNTGFPFLANWWYESNRGRMKMATNIPNIAFGASAVTIYSRKDAPVGKLINGNTFSAFGVYNVRGKFATGRMEVTVR